MSDPGPSAPVPVSPGPPPPDDFIIATSGDPEPSPPPAPEAPVEPPREARESDDLDDTPPVADPPPVDASTAGKVLQKRKQTAQERINDLAREKYLLQGELAALRQQQSSRPAAAVEAPRSGPPPLPPGFNFPSFADWSTAYPDQPYESYTLAATAALIAHDRQQSTAAAQIDSIASAFADRVTAFKAAHPDYDAITSNPDVLAVAHPYLHRAIAESTVGPQIAYFLGAHVDDCRQLATLPTRAQFDRAFGKLEARFDEAGKAPPSAPLKPGTAVPPAPIAPVNTGGPAAVSAPDDLEFGPEYVRQMNAQDRARGRRW